MPASSGRGSPGSRARLPVRPTNLLKELAEQVEPGHRLDALWACPRMPEHPAHVGECLPIGVHGSPPARRGCRRALVERAERAAGLDDHDAHVVGDRVVELAGDSLALFADGALCSLLALVFHEPRPLFERTRVEAAHAYGVADEPRGEEEELGLDQRLRTDRYPGVLRDRDAETTHANTVSGRETRRSSCSPMVKYAMRIPGLALR